MEVPYRIDALDVQHAERRGRKVIVPHDGLRFVLDFEDFVADVAYAMSTPKLAEVKTRKLRAA